MRTGIVTQANGSAFVELGGTKVIASVYGPRPLVRVGGADAAMQIQFGQTGGSYGATTSSGVLTDREFSDECVVTCDWKYSTFSDAIEDHTDENEREMGMLVSQALELAIIRKAYPKSTIDINVLILQDDGACLTTAITCAALSLVHAGIQLYSLVPACSIAISPSNQILMDPTKDEERAQKAEVLLALMTSSAEINLLRQTGNLPPDQLIEVMKLATQGCQHMHSILKKHLIDNAPK